MRSRRVSCSKDHVYNLVCVRSLQGNTDEALRLLEQLFETGFIDVGQLARDGDLDNIRQTKRYRELVSERKAWLASLRLPDGAQEFTVEVPALMECYAVMLYLGNPEHPLITREKDHPYLARVDAYFDDHRDHELVRRLAASHPGEPWRNNLRAHHNLRALFPYEGLDVTRIVRYPVEMRPDLAKMVATFAVDSDFETFYQQNSSFYAAMETPEMAA